jgi:hypothetical protein
MAVKWGRSARNWLMASVIICFLSLGFVWFSFATSGGRVGPKGSATVDFSQRRLSPGDDIYTLGQEPECVHVGGTDMFVVARDANSVSRTRLVDKILSKLEWGKIAFTTPPSMRLGDEEIMELVMSLSKSFEELQSEMSSRMRTDSERVQISDLMEVELTGNNFTITPLNKPAQAVSNQKTTKWQWTVLPTKRGYQSLHLTLTALISVGNERCRYAIRTYHRTIRVQVTAGERVMAFCGKYWTWMTSVLVIPVLGLTVKRVRDWRKEKKQRKMPED